ncbi:glycosyltransferase family 2 protein [uncultured Acinetobacter sp.]|uniref:glycosyltransferase family 2 protein n=1 Tax=uncultured Acinetobacter sp. TaxID=165433 RepID=UPI002585335D|nr:glycosyltransferase family 2 protein [uncultured Acinetobacter sp.]
MNSAIVVLFNPDLLSVEALINVLRNQVDNIILVDNTPRAIKNYDAKSFCLEQVIYINLEDNLGIAKAHNVGIEKAMELGQEYVIIFDQDSSVEDNFVQNLIAVDKKLRVEGKKIAAIGPSYVDIKTNMMAPAWQLKGLKVIREKIDQTKLVTESDHLISSGSLIRLDIFDKVGLMMEELFIDFVDIEWGMRAKQSGYFCYIANNVLMKHSIGDKSVKVPLTNRYLSIHSDFRKYFIIRNAFFLILYSNMRLNWKIVQVPKTFLYLILLCIFVSPRLNNLKIFLIAFKDAITKNMNKGSMC